MINPHALAKSGTEHGHQMALFCWAQQSGIDELQWMFAIPNGGERALQVAANMKAEGVKRGVPDICLPLRTSWACGLWIEMKRPKLTKPDGKTRSAGTTTERQDAWRDWLRGQGYAVEVCYGWLDATAALWRYLPKDVSAKCRAWPMV